MVSFQSGRVGGKLKTLPPTGEGTFSPQNADKQMVCVELLLERGARNVELINVE